MESPKATRQSWPTKPMPTTKGQLEIDAVVEAAAYEKIAMGYIPQNPEDKWFIYLEDRRLHFHRSASGSCIFTADFEQVVDGFAITSAWANRDPNQYKNVDATYDARLLVYLIRRILLKHQVPFPLPNDLPHQNRALHEKHVMGEKRDGTSFIPLDLVS